VDQVGLLAYLPDPGLAPSPGLEADGYPIAFDLLEEAERLHHLQTPAAFNDAPQNVENALRFFKEIIRLGRG
jgi:hypothetical protein